MADHEREGSDDASGVPARRGTERARGSSSSSGSGQPQTRSKRRASGGVRRARRRRRGGLILVLAVFVAAVVVVLEREPSLPVADEATAESTPSRQLQRGGVRVLPNYEVVAYYGAPQAPELGVLGLTPPEDAVDALNVRANEYADLLDKPVYPAFEFISTLAQDAPGPSGEYRLHQSKELINSYLKVATENEFLLILDIQPGRADFVKELKRLRPFLRNPNVGIALDPEWNVGPEGVPGQVLGQVDAEVVNEVAELMSKQAQELDLPQKLLVIHQFTEDMIQNVDKLERFPKVALVLNADGFGSPELKLGAYGRVAPRKQPPYAGFKLFFTEDTDLMSAQDVLALQPRPDFVVYE